VRHFRIKQEEAYSDLKEIKAGVPQGSAPGPVRYVLCTSDLPKPQSNTVVTFADDTTILAVGNSTEEGKEKPQEAVIQITNWTKNGVSN
jgi:hypothetical protein